jgi:hypothetical protein
VRRRNLVGRRLARFDQAEAVTPIGGHQGVRRRHRRRIVAREYRHQRRELGAGGDQLRDARQYRVVVAEDAPQQRSPREVDGE